MKISYNWLKSYIPKIPNPEKLADIFTYHICEVDGVEKTGEGKQADTIFDLNILPNRTHDLLSHLGIAREIAYLLDIPFIDPVEKYKIPESKSTKLEIEIKTKNCRRYMGRIVRGVKVGPSPEWVKTRLESIGQRSINNIVDAANLVMWNSGQPVHAFDLKKLFSEKVIIRMAENKEKMTTLDDREVIFSEKDMVIADEKRVLAIAGIKGGKDSGVDEGTTEIILEVANFDPISVRKTAQSLNIFTDARKRFENDLSQELCPDAMRELSALILEMSPEASFEDIVDIYKEKQEKRKLSFSAERISKILGLGIGSREVEEVLKKYHFIYTEKAGNFEIEIPSHRLDLEIEEDMAEEMGRVFGYDKVEPKIPKIDFIPKENEIFSKMNKVRNTFLNAGYSEVMTYSFSQEGEVGVLASASDKKFLRTNLTDGLKGSLKLNKLNAPLLGLEEVKIFEIGTVFLKDREEIHVAWNKKKEIKEMTLEEFMKESDDFSECSSPNASAQVLGSPLPSARPDRSHKHVGPAVFKPWSPFPFISRDVAVWIPEGEDPEKLQKLLKENGTELLIKDPYVFDSFTKEGKTSYAFRLVFQSFERTLTDAEVNEIMSQISHKIRENSSWEMR